MRPSREAIARRLTAPSSHRLLSAVLFAIILAIAGVTSGRAQQALPTFRAQVDAVEVDAFVTDRNGNPVPNLTIDDFEVLEDKRPQQVTSFSEVNIPITAPAPYSPTAPEPDVATNTGDEGRLYVIVFDELKPVGQIGSDDASSGGIALKARQFLHTFIEQHFEANDIGIVVSVGRARATDMQDFTSSRRLLLRAIDSFSGGFPSLDQAPVLAAGGFQPSSKDDPFAVRQQTRALRDLMESLERIQGRRKAVIYITNEVGDSTFGVGAANVWNVIDYRGGVRSIEFDDLRAAMTSAMRGGVAFYAFDPAGADPLAIGGNELERMSGLRKLSAATGGFAIVNSNRFSEAFTRMVAENSNYYVLGYTSNNEKRDGRYRQLQVRVKRPGLSVRFRDGYIGPSKASDPVEPKNRAGVTLPPGVSESIRNPIANRSVPMRVFAAAYRGTSKDANIVIAAEIDANRLGLVEEGTSTEGAVDVAAIAVSAAGKVTRGQHEQFTLKLKPDTWADVKRSGIRVVTGTTLPPGRYQLRVAGGNVKRPDAGSVMYDLEVPDFSKPPLALSALTVTSKHADATLTIASKTIKLATPIPPTAMRDFTAGDTLSLYAEVYDNRPKDAHRLDFLAELRDGDGHRVGKAVTDTRADGQARQKLEAILPLDVPPGAYVLHVEARSTLAKQPPVSRDVPIQVR